MKVRTTTDAPAGARRKPICGHWGVPLDRNEKVRIQAHAESMVRATESGKHYGRLTAKYLAVLKAILWRFHDARTGRCFPSLEAIAAAAGCARSTAEKAIAALREVGILVWQTRWARVRVLVRDAAGNLVRTVKVVRDSNAYGFRPTPAGVAAGRPTNSGPRPVYELRPAARVGSDTELRSGTEVPSTIPLPCDVGAKAGPATPGARGRAVPALSGSGLEAALARLAGARFAGLARRAGG